MVEKKLNLEKVIEIYLVHEQIHEQSETMHLLSSTEKPSTSRIYKVTTKGRLDGERRRRDHQSGTECPAKREKII